MATSFYDLSVGTYLQTLPAISGILDKGKAFCEQGDDECAGLIETSLHPDMKPLQFQLISVAHHSLGAIKGIQAGEFTPPPSMPDADFDTLQKLVNDAADELRAMSPESVEALSDQSLMFRAGSMELPFTAENFIRSFSLPNFYFHATTAYDILRMKGVALSKMDFLANMQPG